ncbi:unnamed protein product [Parnassius apollo]|uniref:(apollo) hypothetical protein n=1 Tax=Parnassius apollo TaxID=110799 RepID=A0A8S3XMB0_PARAO|nr:unnamed protein product [Parnassius apollo]
MESLPMNTLLEFNKDTLQTIRKDYNLDNPGIMDQAIDVLQEWVKKQNHFEKKYYPREYLERRIIFCKGSVESAKSKIDKNCTLRTLMPQFYMFIDFKTEYKYSKIMWDGLLPKMTDDYYRIFVVKNVGKSFDKDFIISYFRWTVAAAEYLTANDYSRGVIIIIDYSQTNLVELLKLMDFVELRQAITLLIDGYGMRVKAVHIITPSKTAETIFAFCKKMLSAKLIQRIQIHKDFESLHKVVQRDVLPEELGGNERSIIKLHKEWVDVLSSKEFQEYYSEMKAASTNEKYRQTDKFNEEYMGIAGTFKTLNVD